MNKLALKWRISRKHLLQLLISNLAVEPLQPEVQAQGPELNEVVVRRGGEA